MELMFQERFIPLIQQEGKTHTIRRGTRWRKGHRIQFRKSGSRFQKREAFYIEQDWGTTDEVSCSNVQGIRINVVDSEVFIESQTHELNTVFKHDFVQMTPENVARLAQNDGFDSVDAFFAFFRKQYGEEAFLGQIVFWKFKHYHYTADGICFQTNDQVVKTLLEEDLPFNI